MSNSVWVIDDDRSIRWVFEKALSREGIEHRTFGTARDALALAVAISRERRAALLCFEACAAGCHRRIVAERIREATECEVKDL